ncbi:DUF4012 domain-containing protein [Leifsonia sp. NPDC058292]|uniref:DUF4012 domain-containing protein n=1 Tax=Leifsonia sp. NPDC058292 TaxID=3346428 RepID=UPI0036DCBF4E
MAYDTAPRRSRRAASAPRKRLASRWWFWLIVAIVVVAVFVVAWVGIRGLLAKQQLERAMPLVTTLKTQVLAQDAAGAKATLAKIEPKVADARSLTSDPVWRAAEIIPGLGANLRVTRVVAQQTDAVVDGAITPLVEVSGSLSLEALKPKNGAIDVAPLAKLTAPVDKASASVDTALSTLKRLDTAGAIGQVVSAKTKLETMLTPIAGQLNGAKSLLQIVPGVLGADGPRNYLLVFQNNGELMAGGGTVGSMAILHVENGTIQLVEQSSAAPAEFPMFDSAVTPIPEDVAQLYPNSLGRYVQNLTETPRFSLSFDIAKAMWKQAKNIDIDGMISIDTVALAQFLDVTGPVQLPDGSSLDSKNAVRMLLVGFYETYTAEQVDTINQALTQAVFGKLLAGDVDPKKLASFVASASAQHRILLWSNDDAEQKAIRQSAFYGAPPVSSATTDAFGVYFRDVTPSKMALYLKQSVDLAQASCTADGKTDVRVTVTLTNGAPAGVQLPSYVTGKENNIRLRVNTYAPPGFTVAGATVSNDPAAPQIGTDGEYPVVQSVVNILPGETQTVTFDLIADHADARALTARVTPAVSTTTITQGALDCGTWKSK